MKVLGRVLSVFLGLLFIGGALFLLAVNYDLIPRLTVHLPVWADENVVLAVSAAMLLIALILILVGLRPSKKAKTAVLAGGEYGEVEISINAIENMVLRVINQTKGAKDVSRQVLFTHDGLTVKVRIRVLPDVSMPELTSELQSKIKEYVEEITGITVQEVKMLVENIDADKAPSAK